MDSLFLSLWNRSVSAGWLIAALILLRPFLKKAPAPVRCLLWLLAGVRLVCPCTMESPASLIPSAETIPQTVLTQAIPEIHTGISTFNSSVNNRLMQHADTAPAVQPRSFVRTCAQVWIAGMVLLALWMLWEWSRLRRRTAEAVPDGDGVWLCDAIGSPFVLGIFRPRIYLPVGLDTDSRLYVVAHEKAHIRRLDHIAKPVAFLLLAVYWFQPLAWAAYVLLCRDVELACDERVVRELGAECRKPYSEALLQCSVRRDGRTVLGFGEIGVKERVKHVLNYKKPAFWVIAASCAICIAAAVCFLTDPVTPPESDTNCVQIKNKIKTDSPLSPGDGEYITGALLYEMSIFSAYFPETHISSLLLEGTKLTTAEITGDRYLYELSETVFYSPEEFYALFDNIGGEGENDLIRNELNGQKFLPDGTDTVICFIYKALEPNGGAEFSGEIIWEAVRENQVIRQWLGFDRSYALLRTDGQDSFVWPYVNLMQWTFDPSMSTLIPICFDLNGPVSLSVNSGSLYSDLSLTAKEGTKMNIESGQTVYWQPFDSTSPESGLAQLTYSFRTSDGLDCQDQLELRALMDYCGLYGTKTYGISNNWLGVASSAVHRSALRVDGETGGLVVYDYSGGFPYLTNDSPVYNLPRITGRYFPPDVKDVYPVQAYPVQTP